MAADRRTFLAGGGTALLAAVAPVRPRQRDRLIVNTLGGLDDPNNWQEDMSGAGVGGVTRGPLAPRILDDLLRRNGYSELRIEKILGLNFLAFAREVWGA